MSEKGTFSPARILKAGTLFLQMQLSVLGHLAENVEEHEPAQDRKQLRDSGGSIIKRSILNLKQEGGRSNFKWQEALETSKPAPSDIFPPSLPHLPNKSPTAPSTRKQIVKSPRLWSISHSNQHQQPAPAPTPTHPLTHPHTHAHPPTHKHKREHSHTHTHT